MLSLIQTIKEKVLIIAEIGVNHNGDLNLAREMIDVAHETGVDAVKFQTFKTESLVSSKAKKADYQIKNSGNGESQFEMIKKLELDTDTHYHLMDYCTKKGMLFLSSPFDHDSCDLLDDLGVPCFKVPSGEITNLPFLKYIAEKHKPIIVSSGMSNIAEVYYGLEAIYSTGNRDIVLLHCLTEYPAPINEVNLKAMVTMKETFKIPVGYSDHTLGIEIPVAAVALGARIIEKHFTLDKKMKGPDHAASLEPDELNYMVQVIRNVESALGDGIKRPAFSELKNLEIARKSLVFKTDVRKGRVLKKEMLTIKRPGNGVSPADFEKVLGLKLQEDKYKDDVLFWEDLKSEG